MRNTVVAGAVVLAVLGAGAVACQSSVAGQGVSVTTTAGGPGASSGGNSPAAGGDGAGSPSATSSAAPPPGTPITVGPVRLVVPPGWTYTPDTPDHEFDGCLTDGQNACLGRLTDLGPALAQPDAEVNLPSTTRQYGWYTGSDVPLCPTKGSQPGSEAWGGHVIGSGTAPVGPHTASYASFQVQCDQEAQDGVIRMWWLPTSKVVIDEYNSDPDLDRRFDAMLRTATFG